MNELVPAVASPQRAWPRGALWLGAAVLAVSLHLGGAALAAWYLAEDDDAEGLGRASAEFAVELASPNEQNLDLPDGPENQASEESRAQPEQKAAASASEPVPEKMQDESDQVSAPEEKKKPEEEKEKALTDSVPTQEMPSAVDSAPQVLETAKKAERAQAPNLGLGKDDLRLTAAWGRKISAYFSQHLRYPKGKNDRRVVTVGVHLVLNRRGNVVSVEVAKSSGDPIFDEAALAMVRRSDPVPAPPVGLVQDDYSFTLPVVFRPST